jgi:phosphatidate cytidylyltransferase
MSKLAARVLTGTALALVAAELVWLNGRFPSARVPLLVVTLLAWLGSRELDRMGSLAGRGLGLSLYGGTAALAGGFALGPSTGLPPAPWTLACLYAVAIAAVLCARLGARLTRIGRSERPPPAPESWFLALWLLPPLFALVPIEREWGTQGLAVLLVLAKVGDNAAYFVGRSIGKRHPFPHISPGKTVAGCVASLLAGIAAGALVLPFTLGEQDARGFLLGAALGALLNLAAQAGDLSESWVKRRAGVKDSSSLLGPSGGVLDVVDSLLLASPVALLAWSWVY